MEMKSFKDIEDIARSISLWRALQTQLRFIAVHTITFKVTAKTPDEEMILSIPRAAIVNELNRQLANVEASLEADGVKPE